MLNIEGEPQTARRRKPDFIASTHAVGLGAGSHAYEALLGFL
jgi:hypothetical protein